MFLVKLCPLDASSIATLSAEEFAPCTLAFMSNGYCASQCKIAPITPLYCERLVICVLALSHRLTHLFVKVCVLSCLALFSVKAGHCNFYCTPWLSATHNSCDDTDENIRHVRAHTNRAHQTTVGQFQEVVGCMQVPPPLSVRDFSAF